MTNWWQAIKDFTTKVEINNNAVKQAVDCKKSCVILVGKKLCKLVKELRRATLLEGYLLSYPVSG